MTVVTRVAAYAYPCRMAADGSAGHVGGIDDDGMRDDGMRDDQLEGADPRDGSAVADRNLDTVVVAILELLREGMESPGAMDIAERSGLGVRMVFRYFEDPERLYEAAIAKHVEGIAHLLELPTEAGTRSERVAAVAEQRRKLYEESAPVRRIAERYRDQSAAVRANLSETRALLRNQLVSQFAMELATLPDHERSVQVDALEMVTSWSAWTMLREDIGLSASQAEEVMSRSMMALTLTARSAGG